MRNSILYGTLFIASVFTGKMSLSQCTAPTGLSITNIGADSADFSWSGAGTDFDVAIVLAGSATPTSGTIVSGTTYDFNSLSQATSYDAYVREICGPNDTSAWTATSFQTICPVPTNINVSNITTTSADASWTGGGNDYEAIAVPTGNPVPTTGNPVTGTSTTLSGLSLGTGYDLYVREVCGPNDTSAWSTATPFQTATCAVPSNISFTNITTSSVDVSWTGNGTDYEAIAVPSGDPAPTTGNSITGTSTSLSGLNAGTGYDFYIREICGPNDTSLWSAATPFQTTCPVPTNINVTNITSSSADFSWSGAGNNYEAIAVPSGNPVPTTGNSVTGTSTNLSGLSSYSGYDFYVREICGPNDTSGWSAATPFQTACPVPTNLNITNITGNSADFSWLGNGTDFEVAIVLAGSSAPTSGTSVSGTTTYNFSPLNQVTNYDAYVREICGPNDTSAWNFTTFQTAIQTAQGLSCTSGNATNLMSEEMDNSSNWTGNIGSSSGQWQYNSGSTSSGSTGPSGSHSGSGYIYFEASTNGAGFPNITAAMYSPAIDLTNAVNDAELSFWMHAYGQTMGTLEVGVGTSPSGPFTNEFTWTGELQTSGSDPWQNVGIDLSSYIGQTIYLEFTYTSGSNYYSDMAIDLIEVDACIPCSTFSLDLGNDSTYCANDGISWDIDAGDGSNFNWSTGGSSQIETLDTAGTYWLEKTLNNGCLVVDTVVVNEDPFIFLDLGPDTGYCADESINLTLNAQNPTASYSWSNNLTTQMITVDTAGIYNVTVTDTNGCSTSDGVYVVEHQIPNVVLPADSDYCADQTIAYTLNAGNPLASGYLWQDNSTNQTFTATTAGTYWVEVTDINGCTNADTMEVIEDPLPIVNLGNDTSYCDSEDFNITLDADNPTADFWWNDGSDNQTLLVDSDGTYWVEVTSTQNCVNSDTITVVEHASPEVNLGNDTMLAPGYTITLNAGDAGNYLWNDGSTDSTKTVTWNDVPGEFSVQVQSAEGCINADIIYIDANTGIGDRVEGDISIYPNPTRDNVNFDVNLKKGGEMTVEVYSLSGQLLDQQQVVANAG